MVLSRVPQSRLFLLTLQKSKAKTRGMWGGAVAVVHNKNPTQFQVPRDFLHAVQKQPRNYEARGLYDWRGRVKLCYKCRCSGVQSALLSCSYCTNHWHLDCLSPPLAGHPPQPWQCPLHAHSVSPRPNYTRSIISTDPLSVPSNGNYSIANDVRLTESSIRITFMNSI